MATQLNFHIRDEGISVSSHKFEDFVTFTVDDNSGNYVTFYLRNMSDVFEFQKAINDASMNVAEMINDKDLNEKGE